MYDPMVAKLIVWDVDREHATARMLRALGEYHITEPKTLIPFHQALLATEQWAAARPAATSVEDREWLKQLAFPKADPPARTRRSRRWSRPTRSRSRGGASTSRSSAPRR